MPVDLDGRRYEAGPGFIRARECPDCFHTRCGEDCVCNCDAAHAKADAAHFREKLKQAEEELRALRARVVELERDLDACRVELLEARHAVGEAWFAGGATLAEAIERKCRALERLVKDEAEPKSAEGGAS